MAPASTRSASLSAVSTTSSSKTPDAPKKKKFACSFPSCGKAFSRSEHLHRHALNHKDGNNTCQRCSAHFRRRDLLDRHMARHKEKDDEAGGEGLGILATRKRLWRDTDGNIVNARRPSYAAQRRQLSQASRKDAPGSPSSVSDPATKTRPDAATSAAVVVVDGDAPTPLYHDEPRTAADEEDQRPSWLKLSTLPSPPVSEPQSAEQSPSPELSDLDTLYEDAWPVMHQALPEIVNHSPLLGRPSDYPASPCWGPQPFQTFMGAMAEYPYDDLFKPETSLYDWQAWNSQVLSRCREEKYEPLEKRGGREWNAYPGQEGPFKRTFLGMC